MRWSLLGSIGSLGSVQPVEILPSPLVSTTPGHQACEAASSRVLSNATVSIQPMAFSWPKTSASLSSNRLWSAAKQLSIAVNCFAFGSYSWTCLLLGPGSGKYFANLLVAPSLQNAGCCCGARFRAVTQTRPLPSIATLRGSACRCQIFSSPHIGERGVLASSTGPFDGILISVAEFSPGSSTARMSEVWMAP